MTIEEFNKRDRDLGRISTAVNILFWIAGIALMLFLPTVVYRNWSYELNLISVIESIESFEDLAENPDSVIGYAVLVFSLIFISIGAKAVLDIPYLLKCRFIPAKYGRDKGSIARIIVCGVLLVIGIVGFYYSVRATITINGQSVSYTALSLGTGSIWFLVLTLVAEALSAGFDIYMCFQARKLDAGEEKSFSSEKAKVLDAAETLYDSQMISADEYRILKQRIEDKHFYNNR